MTDDIAEYLEVFHEEVGPPSLSEVVAGNAYEKFHGLLPDVLFEIWRRDGWCAYADGIFWTVNPDEYAGILSAWIRGTFLEGVDDFFVYGRSAFGDLYVWSKKSRRVITINCAINGIVAFRKDFQGDGGLTEDEFLSRFSIRFRSDFDIGRDSDDVPLFFDKAKDRLGVLSRDEMYGFFPALVAGGSVNLDNLKKVRLDTHLMILREFSQPEIPYWNFDIGDYDEN